MCEKYKMDVRRSKDAGMTGILLIKFRLLYSPRSVVSCMRFGKIGNYWNQTETFEALKIYIDMNFDGLREDVLSMMAGESVPVNTR